MEEIEWKFEPGDKVVVSGITEYHDDAFMGATGTVLDGPEGETRWLGWNEWQFYNVRLDNPVDGEWWWPFRGDELMKRIT